MECAAPLGITDLTKDGNMKQKRSITLIEMMIVMFLIALITGVIAYNYRGVLDEGKAFKTQAAMEKLETILNLAVANNPELLDDISDSWIDIVEDSPLVRSVREVSRDGWGQEFQVTVEDGRIQVQSDRYEQYVRDNPQTRFQRQEDE